MLRIQQPVVLVRGKGRGHNQHTLLPSLHEFVTEPGQLGWCRCTSPIRGQLTELNFVSAQVVWHFGDGQVLRGAELVMASDLVLLECDRVLIRAVTLREIDEATAADRRAHLNAAAAHRHLWRVSADIVDRARRPFPAEPIRTLDAIHLASALAARSES